MSSIRQKVGTCVDCIEQGDNIDKPIIAGRCGPHYQRYRAKVNEEKKKAKGVGQKPTFKSAKEKAGNTELGKWFETQIQDCPPKCEECGSGIWKYINMGGFWASSLIAHILPKAKSKFPEVATHANNRMFFCPDCHTDFDNKGEEHVLKMKSLPLIKERLGTFYNQLSESQKSRVKEYLKN